MQLMWQALNQQTKYIRENIDPKSLTALSRKLEEILVAKEGSLAHLPRGLTQSIALTVCYAFARHRGFCGTRLFRELLISHLAHHYAMERGDADRLIDAVIHVGSSCEIFVTASSSADEDDFLRTILIECVQAESEKDFVEWSGLGEVILGHIRNAVSYCAHLDEGPAENRTLHFLPDLERRLVQLLLSLREEHRRHEEIYDCYALRAMLKPWPRLRTLSEGEEDSLLLVLARLGLRRELTHVQLAEIWSATFGESPLERCILEDLHAAKLIFPMGSIEKPNCEWALSEAGLALTAIVARQCVWLDHASDHSQIAEKVEKLPVPYQQVVLVRLQQEAPSVFNEFITNAGTRLSMKVLEFIQDSMYKIRSGDLHADASQFNTLGPNVYGSNLST